MNDNIWIDIVIGLFRGAALLFNTDVYKALEGRIYCTTFTILFVVLVVLFIALAISFVSCRSSVVVYRISAASFTAWLVSWLNIAIYCCVIIFCWTLIAVDCTVFAVVLRSFWIVIIVWTTALRSGMFWNLVIRTLIAAIMVLTSGFGTDWSSAESIQTSAFLR